MKKRELSSGEIEFMRAMARKSRDTLATVPNVPLAIAGYVSAAREHLRLAAKETTEKGVIAGMRRAREELAEAKWLRECEKYIAKANAAGIEF